MSWNYRVMRHEYSNGVTTAHDLEIHEVYYNDDGTVRGWTENGISPSGEDMAELNRDLDKMEEALGKPILDYKTGEEIFS